MFGIGMQEMIFILVIALIVIGPKKLPDLAKSLGRAMGEFKKATSDLKESIDSDGSLKDVKQAFTDMNRNVTHTIRSAATEAESQTRASDPAPAQPAKTEPEKKDSSLA